MLPSWLGARFTPAAVVFLLGGWLRGARLRLAGRRPGATVPRVVQEPSLPKVAIPAAGRTRRIVRAGASARPRTPPGLQTLMTRSPTRTRHLAGRARLGPVEVHPREARDSHQRKPAGNPRGHSGGRPAGRTPGRPSGPPPHRRRHLPRPGRGSPSWDPSSVR